MAVGNAATSSATSLTTDAPPRQFRRRCFSKAVEVVLSGRIGDVSEDRSSRCHDRCRGRFHPASAPINAATAVPLWLSLVISCPDILPSL